MSTKRSRARHGPFRRAGSDTGRRVSYTRSAREPLLSEEARALEIRLNRLLARTAKMRDIEARLNELLQQQAARVVEIRVLEQAVERLLGRLSGLSAILTTKTLPIPASAETATPDVASRPPRRRDPAPSCPALPYHYGSCYGSCPPPSRPRIDTALGQWLIARQRPKLGRWRTTV